MDGRCACEAVRYRLTDRPLFVHACHCRYCQRESGSAFALNAMIETAKVEVTAGATVAVTIPSESGNGQVMHRCPDCMVTLWSHYSGAGTKISFIRVGTLDDPDACPPDIHIYTGTKQPWVVLSESVPSVPEFYRRSQYWPDWALERRRAAVEA